MKKYLFITLCLIFTNVSFAARDWYTVEVIVFKNNHIENLGDETWPQNPPLPTAKHFINLKSMAEIANTAAPFQLLPASAFTLSHSIAALSHNSHYTILAKLAWRQKIPNGATSQTIHIVGGRAYNNKGETISTTSSLADWRELDGMLNISRRQYLIVRSNLLLTVPSSEVDAKTSQKLVSFALKEDISMRSKELHYLDNPLFGVLIKITPY